MKKKSILPTMSAIFQQSFHSPIYQPIFRHINIPFTVHRSYFFPCFRQCVIFPTRVEILHSVESSNNINKYSHDDCTMICPRPGCVFVEYPRPSIGFGVVRFDNRRWTAPTPTTDGKQHFSGVSGPGKHRRYGVGHI